MLDPIFFKTLGEVPDPDPGPDPDPTAVVLILGGASTPSSRLDCFANENNFLAILTCLFSD